MEPEVASILQQSRINNQKQKIGGVLYFADGYFFQCLEGKDSAVLDLMDKLKLDDRHEDIKVSYFKRIRRRCFKEWSMKYVPVGPDIEKLIASRGYHGFDPCKFDEADINSIIDLFTRLEDTSIKDERLRRSYRLKLHWWQKFFRPSEIQCL